MAVIPVIISNIPPPSVSITMANYTYTQFINSLGTNVYVVEKMYLFSTTQAQVTKVMNFLKFDSNGNQTTINLTPALSPYQSQGALVINTKGDQVVLDGRDRLSFNLMPNATVMMQLITSRMNMQDYLNSLSPTNYYQVETAMGKVNLFDNYTDKIVYDG